MKIFIAIDGDGVGTKLGKLISDGVDSITIKSFAMGVAEEMTQFAARAEELGATTILCAGDSVLLEAPAHLTSQILRGLKEVKHCTYSGGTGRSIAEATLSLQYAKLNGKAQTWHYQKEKPFFLWLRIESWFSKFSKYAKGHF